MRDGVPTGERRALRRSLRRTVVLRAVLALALLAALALALLLARDAGVRQAPLVSSERTAMVALDLSASIGNFPRIAAVLRRIARDEENAGLVVFSGGAYELLPPGAPAREVGSFARFFTPLREGGEVYPTNPWDVAEFRGGTSIASGLEAARAALRRDGVSQGAIVLASDLDVEADSESVSKAIVAVRRDRIELRIVPVGPLPSTARSSSSSSGAQRSSRRRMLRLRSRQSPSDASAARCRGGSYWWVRWPWSS